MHGRTLTRTLLTEAIYVRHSDYDSFRNATFVKSVKYADGTVAEFRSEPCPGRKFKESVSWSRQGSATPDKTVRMPRETHGVTWSWTEPKITYILKVYILSELSDRMPDGFRTVPRQTTDLNDVLYVRQNDGHGFLEYDPRIDGARSAPVVFRDGVTAALYIDAACENPNLYSVVHGIETEPVEFAWLTELE